MRFFHLGDLHIGKQLHGFNLLPDQKEILGQIVALAGTHRPDAVLIAGDIYDRSIPPGDAVSVFDDFLTGLARLGVKVFIVSGNHDSPERLNFGSRLMRGNGVHLCGTFSGRLERIELADTFGPVHIHLLPFVKPGTVRPFFPDADIESYEDAVRTVVEAATLEPSARNILVAHQFITSGGCRPERCDSETFAVGGVDNVDASVFDGFDYVALGHIHGPQTIGRPCVRYSGSPLKYSFSEVRHSKGVAMIDLGARDDLQVSVLPLQPMHDMRELKGPLAALLAAAREAESMGGAPCLDYVRAILTDEGELLDPHGQLRLHYPNLMAIDFERNQSQAVSATSATAEDLAVRSPLALFSSFYHTQTEHELNQDQVRVLSDVFEAAGGIA